MLQPSNSSGAVASRISTTSNKRGGSGVEGKQLVQVKSMKNLKSNQYQGGAFVYEPNGESVPNFKILDTKPPPEILAETKLKKVKSEANYDMFYPKPKPEPNLEEELSISSSCIKITKDSQNQNHLVLQLDSDQLKQLTQNKNCKSFKIKLVKGNDNVQ